MDGKILLELFVDRKEEKQSCPSDQGIDIADRQAVLEVSEAVLEDVQSVGPVPETEEKDKEQKRLVGAVEENESTDGVEENEPAADGLEKDWVLSEPFSFSTLVDDIAEHHYASRSQLPGNAAAADLQLLASMGFVDRKRNLKLLLQFKGDIAAVVEALLASC